MSSSLSETCRKRTSLHIRHLRAAIHNLEFNEYNSPAHALQYLGRADGIPHRAEGEAALLEFIPRDVRRILDLGTGDGRLLALLRVKCPSAEGVAVDLSPTMLEAARTRFAGDPFVHVAECDLDLPLRDFGRFDAVVSSFAIHHCTHDRKRALYAEIFGLMRPGGVFFNLEHVASATPRLHERFLDALGITAEQEDRSNKLLDVPTQLVWLREIGFADVDCHWKWRELALFGGAKP